MALTPSNPNPDAEKRAQREASQQDALLREVDEAVRQDEFTDLAKRYGRPAIAVVVAGLLAFGGWLWWTERQEGQLEQGSEEIVKAVDQFDANNFDTAGNALAELEKDGSDAAVAIAKMTRAGIAFRQGRTDEAAKLYGEVAADDDLPKPYRDLANIREVSLRYESMKPEEVVARMKPLAKPGTPFFGSAGELLGAAYLDQGKQDLAGPLFAEIAKDEDVPESLRSRARQLSGLMGVDAIEDVDETLKELEERNAAAAAPQ